MRWRERRQARQEQRWNDEHRWDRLARYNSEVVHGIVHTAEYAAKMAEDQGLFDAAHGIRRASGG